MTDTTDPREEDESEEKDENKSGWIIVLLLLLLLGVVVIWFLFLRESKDAPVRSAPGIEAPQDVGLNEGKLDDDDSVRAFIKRFIKSGESDDPAAELSFYAEVVDSYFDKTSFDKAMILKDRTSFVEKWPERRYEVIGDPEIVERQDDVVIAMAQYRFDVTGETYTSDGRGFAFYRIRQRGKDLEIFWIGEKLED